jgi:hypothetical protein
MADLWENKLLYRSLQACYAVLMICALEAFPPLNDLLQLTAMPSVVDSDLTFAVNPLTDVVRSLDFPVFFCVVMVVETILVFLVERTILSTFEGKV